MWPLLLAVCLLLIPHQIGAQISKPVAHDDNVKADTNKFLERQASDDLLGFPNLDEEALANTQCPRNVELRWQAEVSSSIYASPLIADINGDGKLDIVVPTFVHYLEVLEGADGEKLPGWPVYHQSVAHSSPLLYDIDKDGLREILLPTYNGEILIFRSGGFLSSDKLTVPRLRVRKDWYVGLNPDHADRSHPDVHDDLVFHGPVVGNNSAADKSEASTNNGTVMAEASSHNSSTVELVISNQTIATKKSTENTTSANNSAPVVADAADAGITTAAAGMTTASINETKSMRRLLEQDPGSEQKSEQEGVVGNELSDEYAYDYDDYVDDAMWGDEEFQEAVHEREEDYVNVDAHILSTPVIADIDGDGVDELVVAGSFFYDREYYEDPAHASELNNIDISKYVAGAVVVFNLETKQVKWSVHLDLSTDTVQYRAYIYSSPTVVDLDGDGKLSIIVGTSFGYVYALHHNGTVRKNFPLQMGEIQAQVIAADVNDDGVVEIITADTRGNIAAWTAQGVELWENHVKSLVAQAPTVGDVNGDGETEIVVPTVSGNVYVLKGKNGQFVPPFPFRTHGRVMSSVLLVDFNKESARRGLTLVCTSFDGYLYLIDGSSGCADAIDIGETSYSMVLADNVDGGDDLDLVVSTMNGNVYCFQTPVRHHPLKAWPMLSHGRNVMSSRYDRQGIFVLPASRTFRDEAGESFWVSFKIVDKLGLQGPYNVTITLLVPGNYQGKRRISQSRLYQQPGTQSIKLPCVPVRTTGTVTVEMVDKHGLYFWDEFSLTFHMRYHRLLKWMILSPMLAMMAGLYLLHSGDDQAALPTFSSRNRLD